MEDDSATTAGAQTPYVKSPGSSTLSRTQRGAIAAQVSLNIQMALDLCSNPVNLLCRHAIHVGLENKSVTSEGRNVALATSSSWNVVIGSRSLRSTFPANLVVFLSAAVLVAGSVYVF